MKFLALGILFLALYNFTNAKIYSKCELARKLDQAGIPRNKLPDWVCLVNFESSFNSRAKSGRNSNGSYDWGIFQINDGFWCSVGSNGKDCNANCNDFINDDITVDITCAKKIYSRHGFEAWYGWKNHCKGKSLAPYSVDSCFKRKTWYYSKSYYFVNEIIDDN